MPPATSTVMSKDESTPSRLRWARLRFSIIGPLLAAPPPDGELKQRLDELAARSYRHPLTGEAFRVSFSTIERWFYAARDKDDPVTVLARKVHARAGTFPTVSPAVAEVLAEQHRAHPGWTFQLHHDNLVVSCREKQLGTAPKYGTVCRYMKQHGLLRSRKPRSRKDEATFEPRERRSYEVEYVHGLWHLDFHEASRAVLLASGEWKKPLALGVLDDRSRLCCHLQWYLAETAEALIHGLCQAFAKRGLPRALLTDNGAAMLAAETVEGLERLGIVHATTLPYSPEQNGKQESFWGQVEGRLLAMLEGERVLTLKLLNDATQAWVEGEYHHKKHSETGQTPLERYHQGRSVGRESPSSDGLRRAFRTEIARTQRRSDGTVTVEGVRFEVPSAYRTLTHLKLRVARWELSSVDLVDPRDGHHLASLLPLDKARNAERVRRILPSAQPQAATPPSEGMAPLLRSLMAEYAATGMPPGFVTQPENDDAPTEKT